ncbi:MAG: tetratricopeptide repeat protein [Pyrinomonadaceae bacterium]|nr:tetratricopeptide repeat protein [Phycisphaerales bacterium]
MRIAQAGISQKRSRIRRLLAAAATCVSLGVVCTLATPAVAQVAPDAARPRAMAAPARSKALTRVLDAEYQTEADRKEFRLFHGLWKASDLDTPQRIAAAALMTGAVDDPSLSLPEVDPLLRAEAAMLRGELAQALATLDAARGQAPETMRSSRIRVQTLDLLGRYDEALQVARTATEEVIRNRNAEAEEAVEAARTLGIALRITGPSAPGSGSDYQSLIQLLDKVRNEQDKLYWPARLAQAELLYEKDNSSEAGEALKEVLSLNPSCAQAWAMLGQMGVDSFNFDMMESVANRLDLLASGRGGDHDPADGEEGDGNGNISLHAGLIRARAMIRQSDPELAEVSLQPVLSSYPRSREALAVRCAIQAIRYDAPATDRLLAEFDRLSPGSPLAAYEVGKALSESRQYDMAAPYLERASQLLPKWAAPLIELGLMEIQSGKLDEALPTLERAVALDPFNVRTDNSLRLVKELQTYQTVQSEHFIVRYKAGDDSVLAADMLEPLETTFSIVTGDADGGIDYKPRQKTVIDLMPDHKWFGVRIAGLPAIHTIAASTGPCIAMEAPREGKGHLGPYDWVRVVRHEYTHTVTLERTSNRIPHWFTEAAAVYLELSPRDYSTCQLLAGALGSDSLFDMTEINTAFVRPRKPTDRSQAYAQGHWMYEFIVKTWGKRAPLDLMDLYAKGQREESSFVSVLGISRDEFLGRFKTWAREQVIEWGMALPPDVPGIKDLLLIEAMNDAETGPAIKARADRVALDAALSAGDSGGTDGTSIPPRADAQAPDAQAADAGGDQPPTLPEPTSEMIARWRGQFPTHPDVLELALRQAMQDSPRKEMTAQMVPLLEQYAAARPVDPFPHQQLAKLLLAGAVPGRSASDAIEHLEYLDAREQKSSSYAVELAKRYVALQDWTKAWTKAERSTQISPYDAGNRELAATVAIKRRDYPAAQRHINALITLEPNVAVHKQRLEAVRKLVSGPK